MKKNIRKVTLAGKAEWQRQPITFYFDGRAVEALEGDTVASALYAAGRRVFGRSFKYHRPRGLYCMSGRCPNCLMTVDGKPNVRTCVTPVKEGMKVQHQNAWPSLDHDVLAAGEAMDSQMEAGFYYKKFIRPPLDWMRVRGAIRKVAGLASLPKGLDTQRCDKYYLHADIAVIGAGPTGLEAALTAGKAGLRVLVADDFPEAGGHLRFTGYPEGIEGVTGPNIAAQYLQELESLENVEILTGALVFGLYEGNFLGIEQGNRFLKVRAREVIVATGCHEKQEMFENNERPGVMMGRSALLLTNLYGVFPGQSILVSAGHDKGWQTALELLRAGANLAGVIDHREKAGPEASKVVEEIVAKGIPVYWNSRVQRTVGHPVIRYALVENVQTGAQVRVRCDTLVMASGYQGYNGLLFQAEAKMVWDETLWDFVPGELPEGVWAAGEVLGGHSLEFCRTTGRLAAMKAIAALSGGALAKGNGKKARVDEESIRALESQAARLLSEEKRGMAQDFTCQTGKAPKQRFVCICEDITVKNLEQSIAEGYDNIETLKRFSTLSMGPCQGKICSLAGLNICAKVTGKHPKQVGTTTSRPPVRAVTMGMLAGRMYHPERISPMHTLHKEAGASFMQAGAWLRPEHYGNIEAEYKAVRERAGVIDVSTLGKFLISGKDAVTLLDFIYTSQFASLKPGKTRYGVICTDAGVLLDDGTVGRLDEDRYFITTTTGNAEAVDQWISWQLTLHPEWEVEVLNATSLFAAVNLAGPKARDILQHLTNLDVSAEGFPYLKIAEGTVAGIPAIVLRIGFVGEVSYEIHVQACYGRALWEALLAAGQGSGIRPFGVEAQRIMRLEKIHLIPGTDTDALAGPLEAGVGWAVKTVKEDFIGKPMLEAFPEGLAPVRLVGFELNDPKLLAEEGSQILEGGKPVGRVTSSRKSPGLGKSIGMAWVPTAKANEGEAINIQHGNGGQLKAVVRLKPFYDPEGVRLKG